MLGETLQLAAEDLAGAATTGEPSFQARSAISMAVPSFQGTRRSVDRSGCMAKSPYPRSQEDMAYPSTVFISVSTARR